MFSLTKIIIYIRKVDILSSAFNWTAPRRVDTLISFFDNGGEACQSPERPTRASSSLLSLTIGYIDRVSPPSPPSPPSIPSSVSSLSLPKLMHPAAIRDSTINVRARILKSMNNCPFMSYPLLLVTPQLSGRYPSRVPPHSEHRHTRHDHHRSSLQAPLCISSNSRHDHR